MVWMNSGCCANLKLTFKYIYIHLKLINKGINKYHMIHYSKGTSELMSVIVCMQLEESIYWNARF